MKYASMDALMEAVRPMLAASTPVTPDDIDFSKGPVWCSPKLDGIRNLQMKSISKSRKLIDIPNQSIQKALGTPVLDGMDGELIVGLPEAENCIQTTTSGVMSAFGSPAFAYYVFDVWDSPGVGFATRKGYLRRRVATARRMGLPVILLPQTLCTTREELVVAVGRNYEMGLEGSIIRNYDGLYKFNRSTLREGLLLKVKESVDSEIHVTGFLEMKHNQNAAVVDELGLTKRSTHKAGKVAAGTLGKLVGIDTNSGKPVIVGTGKMTAAEKLHVWQNQHLYLGAFAKYRYSSYGVKDGPRFPRFICWRDPIDM